MSWPPPDPYELHIGSCRGTPTLKFLSAWDDSFECRHFYWKTEQDALVGFGKMVSVWRSQGVPVPTPGKA